MVEKILRSFMILLAILVCVNLIFGYVKRVWKGSSRVVIALSGDSLNVLSLDPKTESGVLMMIPDEMMINAALGFGKYKAGSIAGLDIQEKQDGNLIKLSVSKHMGILVDGLIRHSKDVQSKTDIERMLVRQIGLKSVGSNSSDLSMWDLIRVWWNLIRLRDVSVELISLDQILGYETLKLPDGSMVLDISYEYLDQLSREYLIDEVIANNDITVGVINTTGRVGLGRLVARILSNSGFHVVFVETDDLVLMESNLLVNDKSLSSLEIMDRLEKLLEAEVFIEEVRDSRAQVIVKLGKDIEEVFY